MANALSKIGDMPGPVKIGVAALTTGSILTIAWVVMPPGAWPFVIAGLALAAVLVVIYRLIVKTLEKRRANPFTKRVMGNAAAAPGGVSDASRRAMLDDLRKTFESGVEKFRAAGKNLYSMPWYLLVGEPGSGKTEAIRRSQVGFPPGLQDPLQGAGGTINMNWWFTIHAVILDTAGRLMFEETPPGQTSEWQELLKLLRTSRPNCPINGMILVIPADSLIQDTADAIERKAGRIAEQFDQIQRSLGVRFPVYVVVTKCDRINGFREFFDDIGDPQLQHQILGWSNPGGLDEAFNPDRVIAHLETVKQRMVQRRWLLLQDPVHTEDAQSNRLDQVDALYAFPESLMQIGPRLRRYLEMIFVTGPWSSKPLFLRGIYFTSSLREGASLDADLAAALGVSAESLPEGRVWERERAYFLRELFLSKIFRERGLVTRATNARAQQRRRRAMAIVGACVMVLTFIGLTILGTRALERSINHQRDFWPNVAKIEASRDGLRSLAIIVPPESAHANAETFTPWEYRGAMPLGTAALGGWTDGVPDAFALLSLADVQRRAHELALQPLRMPAVFVPVSIVLGRTTDLSGERIAGHHRMFEIGVMDPLLHAAREAITRTPVQAWTPAHTEALIALMRVESRAAGDPPKPEGGVIKVAGLFALACGPDDWEARIRPLGFQAMADAVARGDRPASWAFAHGTPGAISTINLGVERFVDSRIAAVGEGQGQLATLVGLRNAMREFVESQRRLEQFSVQLLPATPTDHARYVEEWRTHAERLTDAARRISDAERLLGLATDPGLDQIAREAFASFRNTASRDFDALLAEARAAENRPQHALSDAYVKLTEGRAAVLNRVASLETEVIAQLSSMEGQMLSASASGRRKYRLHLEMVTRASDVLMAPSQPAAQPVGLRTRIDAVDLAAQRAASDIANAVASWGPQGPEILQSLKAACDNAVIAGRRGQVRNLIDDIIDRLPATSGDMARSAAASADASRQMPSVPMSRLTGGDYRPDYDPVAGGALIADIHRMAEETLPERDVARGVLGATEHALRQAVVDRRSAAVDYAREYLNYWMVEVPGAMVVASGSLTWGAYLDHLAEINVAGANIGLREVYAAIEDAIKALPAGVLESDSGVAEFRRRAAGQARLHVRDLEPTIRDNISAWMQVDRNAAEARARLGAVQAAAFRNRYLGGDARDLPYWGSLFIAGLEILARDYEDDARRVRAQLESPELARFPLVVDHDQPANLAPAQYERARSLFASIDHLEASQPGRATPGNLVRDGADVGHGPAQALLAVMYGKGAAWQAADVDLPARLREIFIAFPMPQKTRCALWILPSASQDKPLTRSGPRARAAYEDYPFIAVDVGQARAETPISLRNRAQPEELRNIGGGRLLVPIDETVTIRFHTAEEAPPGHQQVLPSSWHVVRLLHERDVEYDAATRLWHVPVEFSVGNVPYVLWLGVRFMSETNVEQDVPPPNTWPKPANGRK